MTNNKQQTAVDIDLLYAKVRHASDYVDYIKNKLFALEARQVERREQARLRKAKERARKKEAGI